MSASETFPSSGFSVDGRHVVLMLGALLGAVSFATVLSIVFQKKHDDGWGWIDRHGTKKERELLDKYRKEKERLDRADEKAREKRDDDYRKRRDDERDSRDGDDTSDKPDGEYEPNWDGGLD